jgi:hypothetical protein
MGRVKAYSKRSNKTKLEKRRSASKVAKKAEEGDQAMGSDNGDGYESVESESN